MENKSLPSSTDEGFEDSRSGDFTKSPPLSHAPFIDFRKPKEAPREKVILLLHEIAIYDYVFRLLMRHRDPCRTYKSLEAEARNCWR